MTCMPASRYVPPEHYCLPSTRCFRHQYPATALATKRASTPALTVPQLEQDCLGSRCLLMDIPPLNFKEKAIAKLTELSTPEPEQERHIWSGEVQWVAEDHATIKALLEKTKAPHDVSSRLDRGIHTASWSYGPSDGGNRDDVVKLLESHGFGITRRPEHIKRWVIYVQPKGTRETSQVARRQ